MLFLLLLLALAGVTFCGFFFSTASPLLTFPPRGPHRVLQLVNELVFFYSCYVMVAILAQQQSWPIIEESRAVDTVPIASAVDLGGGSELGQQAYARYAATGDYIVLAKTAWAGTRRRCPQQARPRSTPTAGTRRATRRSPKRPQGVRARTSSRSAS